MTRKLEGKVAVITGAGRGIGKADALLFASEGASVVIGDIDETPVQEVINEIRAAGGKVAGTKCDVTKPEDCQQLIKLAIEEFGKLNILVNNAGLTRDSLIHSMTEAQWDSVLDISLKGTFNCIKAASRHMMKTGHNGRIVNVSSTSGLFGNIGQINYAAAKSGIVGLTKTVAREWQRFGVTCNAVAYGLVDTRLTRPKEEQQEEVDGSALGLPKKVRDSMLASGAKLMTAEDAAKPVLFLASDDAAFITGQTINISAGVYM